LPRFSNQEAFDYLLTIFEGLDARIDNLEKAYLKSDIKIIQVIGRANEKINKLIDEISILRDEIKIIKGD